MRILLTFALLVPLSAFAVEDKEIALCASKKGTVERLSCFDQLADRHGLAPKTVVTPTVGKGKWATSTSTDPLTDKSIYLAFLVFFSGTDGIVYFFIMVVRCRENQI